MQSVKIPGVSGGSARSSAGAQHRRHLPGPDRRGHLARVRDAAPRAADAAHVGGDEALAAGADDIMQKPFEVDALVDKVCRLTGVRAPSGA